MGGFVNAASATVTSVTSSASSVLVLAANTSRLGASVYNNSTQILYLKCGTTASATDFTVEMAPEDYWEAPYGYTARLDGIWGAANGAALVTEFS